MVNAGNLVRANDQTPLVAINQVTPIYVSFAFPEALLPDLRRYMAQGTLRVEARPANGEGPAAIGRITFVDNAVDQTTGTIKIKGTFPNDDRRLWPGQFVNVVVRLATEAAAIVVPSLAVQTGPEGTYVYLVKADQTVEMRPVTVARRRRHRDGDQGRTSRPATRWSPTAICVWCPAAASACGAPAARRRDHELRRSLHQAADHDDAHHAGHQRVRRDVVSAAAGQRSAHRRLSHHSGAGRPARREPGDDGLGGRAAARKAVCDHRRPRLGELDEHAGQHEHHAAVRR